MVNSIVFYFFIIFHWYLHAFVNARSRKRLFQDALFFDGFAFRHRKTTKKLDFSLFFLAQLFHCMFARRVSAVKRLILAQALFSQRHCHCVAYCHNSGFGAPSLRVAMLLGTFFLRSFQAWSIPPVCTLTLLP